MQSSAYSYKSSIEDVKTLLRLLKSISNTYTQTDLQKLHEGNSTIPQSESDLLSYIPDTISKIGSSIYSLETYYSVSMFNF